MATPISWAAPLDPHESKDYEHSFAAELTATSDAIDTSLFILPGDAVSAGLEIDSQSETETGGVVFFSVAEESRDDPMFDGAGTIFRIRHQITTTGGRRLERSINLTVSQL